MAFFTRKSITIRKKCGAKACQINLARIQRSKALPMLLFIMAFGSPAPVDAVAQKGASASSIVKNEPAAKIEPGKDIVILGNASVVQLSTSWWPLSLLLGQEDGYMSFFIRSRSKTIEGVQITSSGLGPATFALDGSANGNIAEGSENKSSEQLKPTMQKGAECVEDYTDGAPCLLLGSLTQAGQRIRVRLPARLLPNPGTSADGKIIIFAPDQARVEVPVKLQHPASTLSMTFFGITIPALLSFALGYLTSVLNGWRAERQKQRYLFYRYKERNYDELKDFFGVRYATLHKKPENVPGEFGRELFELLRSRNHLRVIPLRERKRLEKRIRRGKQKNIKRALCKTFPEWKKVIENPE